MDFLYPFKSLELFFYLDGDGGFDIFGGNTLIARGNKDVGYGDIRFAFPGQHPITVSAKYKYDKGQHQDTDSLAYRSIRYNHLVISAGWVTFFTTFNF